MKKTKKRKFSISSQLKSFGFAFNGLKIMLVEEHNSRIHFLAAIGVVLAGLGLQISIHEWIVIIFAIGFVIALEIFNSVIENIADFVHPGHHELIKKIKDLSAAGVLVSTITAAIVGLLVFVPKILSLISTWQW